jgi:hypothetical protein
VLARSGEFKADWIGDGTASWELQTLLMEMVERGGEGGGAVMDLLVVVVEGVEDGGR